MDKNGLQYQLYKLDNDDEINALVKDETIWLTQKSMGELFDVDRTSITRHLKNIFESGELEEEVVCVEIALTTQHGALSDKTQTRDTKFYYLDEREIRRLERGVSGFFDYVEDLIEDEVLLKMEDFAKSIDEFLQFRRYKILTHKGRISMQDAKDKAYLEYEEFNKTQKINSDFEKQITKIKGGVQDDE